MRTGRCARERNILATIYPPLHSKKIFHLEIASQSRREHVLPKTTYDQGGRLSWPSEKDVLFRRPRSVGNRSIIWRLSRQEIHNLTFLLHRLLCRPDQDTSSARLLLIDEEDLPSLSHTDTDKSVNDITEPNLQTAVLDTNTIPAKRVSEDSSPALSSSADSQALSPCPYNGTHAHASSHGKVSCPDTLSGNVRALTHRSMSRSHSHTSPKRNENHSDTRCLEHRTSVQYSAHKSPQTTHTEPDKEHTPSTASNLSLTPFLEHYSRTSLPLPSTHPSTRSFFSSEAGPSSNQHTSLQSPSCVTSPFSSSIQGPSSPPGPGPHMRHLRLSFLPGVVDDASLDDTLVSLLFTLQMQFA